MGPGPESRMQVGCPQKADLGNTASNTFLPYTPACDLQAGEEPQAWELVDPLPMGAHGLPSASDGPGLGLNLPFHSQAVGGWVREAQRTQCRDGVGWGKVVLGVTAGFSSPPVYPFTQFNHPGAVLDSCWLSPPLGPIHQHFLFLLPWTECPEADWSPSLRCPGPVSATLTLTAEASLWMALCHPLLIWSQLSSQARLSAGE